MLQELAAYAQEHGLAARAGFKPKKLKAYVLLSADGHFLGIQVRDKAAPDVYAPDIGSAANGTRYCNPLVEKAKIPLCIIEDEQKDANVPTKHQFTLSMLDAGGAYDPAFVVVADCLRSESRRMTIAAALSDAKLKPADPIGFMVDGAPLEAGTAWLPWWETFRQMFTPKTAGAMARCLITGELAPNLPTVPKVSGLFAVGGHTSGDAFLCFDKDAFQSYGLKKSDNAPVSEEAMTAVNAALTKLIADAPTLGGAKQVHWYAGGVPAEADPLALAFEGMWGDEEDDDEPADAPAATAPKRTEAEREAIQAARRLFESIEKGEHTTALNARYYVMPLTGAGGRMMIRGWYEGHYEDLYRNVDMWFDDLRLVTPGGGGQTRPPKLKALCIRLLKPGGDPSKVFSRIDEELPSLTGRIIDAIINGAPLPDEVASRTLRWLRSAMVAGEQEEKRSSIKTEAMAYQLLKAWLRRKQRQRGEDILMGENVKESPKTAAYCCGQLMAVYGLIHEAAMPNVNVSVTERYYTSASTTPAFVIGKLAKMSTHHLAMLDKRKAAYYRRELERIALDIDLNDLPRTLNMEQQTEFALGYYQQRAAMFVPHSKHENDATDTTDADNA